MQGLHLSNVTKSYGTAHVIHGVDIVVEKGEFCVFVGPSGCGKSTLLRMIAGLEDIGSGDLHIDGQRVNDVEPSKRGVAMVFQSYALYPHMTVRQNLGFGLRMAGVPAAEAARKVDDVANVLQITSLLERTPRQLSGGQRQRVAIGRALVREPKVFLFDEPLSNLDAELRAAMRVELAKLHRRLTGTTMVYVTHDQVEAMTLADKIVVLKDGKVEQIGTPMDLYHNPINQFVAGFLGSPKMNFIDVVPQDGSMLRFRCGGTMTFNTGSNHPAPTVLGVRPDGLRVTDADQGAFNGEVSVIERLGDNDIVYVRVPWDQDVIVRHDGNSTLRAGDRIGIRIDGSRHFFDANGVRISELAA